jgi:hypothetical protein
MDIPLIDTVCRISKGNPGALTVLLHLLETNNLLVFLAIMEEKLEGGDIWLMYKDICDQDYVKMTGFFMNPGQKGTWEAQVDALKRPRGGE